MHASTGAQGAAWPGTVRGLFFVAMAVFLVTIGIGIVNGLDLFDFDHDQVLTHVHSGTLGWITLSIVASAAWYARGMDRRLAWTLGVLVPAYVLSFFLAIPVIRAAAGGLLLVAILWLLAWAWRVWQARRTVTALALALGLTTFTYGAVIGVLRQVQLANGPTLFPSTADVVGAHASAMVFSYLILVAMGLLEWRVLGTAGQPRAAVAQLLLLFGGGLLISMTLLFLTGDAIQAAGGLYLLVELVAVVIFAIRVLPAALRMDRPTAAEGHLLAAAVFVVVATAIFLYVVFRFITDPTQTTASGDIGGILVASDHSAFIGVVTNLMFGQLHRLTADQRGHWSWADRVVLWGVNLGLAVFLVGLVAQSSPVKEIGSPIMGVSLLLGLAVLATRLRTSDLSAASDLAAAEA